MAVVLPVVLSSQVINRQQSVEHIRVVALIAGLHKLPQLRLHVEPHLQHAVTDSTTLDFMLNAR